MNFDLHIETQHLDETLDVQKRLTDLRTWRGEFEQINQALTERIRSLNAEKHNTDEKRVVTVIDRKIAMYAMHRKRYRILVARIPLEILKADSPSEQTGRTNRTKSLMAHLHPQYAGLSKTEKILWLYNNLYFFMTPDIRELDDEVLHIMDCNKRGDQRNLLINGGAGVGKTRYISLVLAYHMPIKKETYNWVPVIAAEALKADRTTKSILQQIILGGGENYVDPDSVDLLMNNAISTLEGCGTELLFVDEAPHLEEGIQRRRLLELTNRTQVSIVAAGVDILKFVEHDDQLADRFPAYYPIKPYQGKRLTSLLSFVDLVIPFSSPSFLPMEEIELELPNGTRKIMEGPAKIIDQKAKGSFRNIMRIIIDAAEAAINRGDENISVDVLRHVASKIRTNEVDADD